MTMKEIKVSEGGDGAENIGYVGRGLAGFLSDFNGSAGVSLNGERSTLTLKINKQYADLFKGEVEDRIADVIAVRYKYAYFRKNVRFEGLDGFETELLRAALIAADLDEDKKYIIRRLRNFEEYAIDGIYNFRLAPLKRKWNDIVGYIPPYFSNGQLKDFVKYLLGEKRNKRVIVENGEVYDENYNKLDRVSLTDGGEDGKIVREVLLSASGKVSVRGDLPSADEKYIRAFYGVHATFYAG